MKKLSQQELNQLVESSQLLQGIKSRPGILLTADNQIAKFFHRRKKISSALFWPQALRFTRNSRKLLALDIAAPVVNDVVLVPTLSAYLVYYDRLPGSDIRKLCSTDPSRCEQILPLVVQYMCSLHGRGIFFRAIHLGNLLMADTSIALLDITDLSVRSSPISLFKRARNIAHLVNADKEIFSHYGLNRFVADYINACQFGPLRKWLFVRLLHSALDRDSLIDG